LSCLVLSCLVLAGGTRKLNRYFELKARAKEVNLQSPKRYNRSGNNWDDG